MISSETILSGLFIMDNEDEEETSGSQSRNQLPFTPPQESSRPRYVIPRPTSTLRTPSWTLTDVAQAPAEQDNSTSQQPFPSPSQESVQIQLPPVEIGARFTSVPPEEVLEISDDNIVDEYIESRLRQMNKTVLDDDYEMIRSYNRLSWTLSHGLVSPLKYLSDYEVCNLLPFFSSLSSLPSLPFYRFV